MRRREQREHIFKLLFMTEFNSQNEMKEQQEIYLDEVEKITDRDREYIQEKYAHVMEHIEEIDKKLNEISRGWRTRRMNRVDLTALRLAAYEIEYDQDVPVGVAINEAVELAKKFGGEASGSFVNGILGKIANAEGTKEGTKDEIKPETKSETKPETETV